MVALLREHLQRTREFFFLHTNAARNVYFFEKGNNPDFE
jgi:hypothetical protein